MSIEFLKKATKTAASDESKTRQIVADMLAAIEAGGEDKAREYAAKLDNFTGNIVVTPDEIEAAAATLSQQVKDDIQFAYDRIRRFAEKQREALIDFEVEISPGLFAGQKQIPVTTAGCYIPGGRYSHVASAIMSVATAKVAGVEHIVACSPPKPDDSGNPGVNAGILYTAHLCGADTILALGGVQGIAAMAFGLFSNHPADILVGPGNRFVAEAKRMLFGRVGIDLFAGPTEIAVIADKTADPLMVAVDLVGQAEHGLDSPCWLITTDRQVGEQAIAHMPGLIASLPDTARTAAEASWA